MEYWGFIHSGVLSSAFIRGKGERVSSRRDERIITTELLGLESGMQLLGVELHLYGVQIHMPSKAAKTSV